MFVAFLDWVRESDGNYALCRRLSKVIRNILDYLLAAPAYDHMEQDGSRAAGDDTNSAWEEFDSPEWLTLLDLDWTQKFELEIESL